MDVGLQFELINLLHFEGLPVEFPHVFALLQEVEVAHQVQELSIFQVIFKWRNWDSVGELCAEGINCIINDDHVLHVTIIKHSQILDVHVICCLDAVISVDSMLYQLLLGVYVVEDNVGIPAVARSENDDLEMLVDFL